MKDNSKFEHFKLLFVSFVESRVVPYLLQARDYWLQLTDREKFIIKFGGIILGASLAFVVASWMYNLEDSLKTQIAQNSVDLANAKILKLKMQNLDTITANDYTPISIDKIRAEVTGLFKIKDPDVRLDGENLIITLDNVKFDLTMLFLEQMRNSYGVFPDKLRIYRAASPGLVDFYVVFQVEN